MPTTALLMTLLILSEVTGIPCGNMLAAPSNVHFLSINLQNIVHWKLAGEKGCRILSTVQYKVYGEKNWKNKKECQNVTRTHCDLSNETADYEEYYYARVRAVSSAGFSDWNKSGRFNPKVETNISSPKITVETGVGSINITLTAPKKWMTNNEARAISLAKAFPDLKYKLSVINRKTNKSLIFLEDGKFKKVDALEHNTTYCVTAQSVEYSFYRISEPSELVCATTPKDPTKQLIKMILLGCVLPVFVFIFLFALMGYFTYKYVCISDQKQPLNLLLQYRPSKKTFIFIPSEPLKINIMVFENGSNKALSHSCMDPDDCETSLTSQFGSKSANKWSVTLLSKDSSKIVYKSQTVENPTTEECASSRQNVVQAASQPQQTDHTPQSQPSNGKEAQNEVQYGITVMENISQLQQQQDIQLPSKACTELQQAGYRSQLPLWPLIRKVAQHNVEYSFIGTDAVHSPQHEQILHRRNGEVEEPQQTGYISRTLASGMNTQTIGSTANYTRIGSYGTIDPQQESFYLPKMLQKLEQSNYKSQFQPQSLTGMAPQDGVDHCPVVMVSSSHLLNEKHHDEVKEPYAKILDWDINTGRLTIPAVSIKADSENSDSLLQTVDSGIGLFSSLYTKDLPEETMTEEDTYISQFRKHWRLHVQI
ncbi:interleukin-20 receptor subunit alpha-like isoform X1 [Carcharodon carcharias]|uniref:interleukin-20 receptor subunit alpha-like isoform X1 n=1 Tax=Carcharodon carcharias TaxID=13397 RepID=UPI001B7EFC3A|nr:interleukin-20 receptor subunit alpha-like isoform X1 [Carcharodon carcharias]